MSILKTVEVDDQLQTELTAAGDKLVVVYYSAAWCAPCKKMKPVVEALSKKHPSVIFLKLDVDSCQETAIAQGVTAMPTFAFHKNTEKIDVVLGADPVTLEEKINQHAATSKNSDSSMIAGQTNLASAIAASQCECMNESDGHPFSGVLADDDRFLESDCDPQLIMSVRFHHPVKIHSLRFTAPKDKGPKDLRIFINQPHTLDFDAAESNTAIQELSLSPSDLDGRPVPLNYVKFQNVTNVQIYVKNNQSSAETTVVNRLEFLGSPIPSTNMGDFKRLSGKKGVMNSIVNSPADLRFIKSCNIKHRTQVLHFGRLNSCCDPFGQRPHMSIGDDEDEHGEANTQFRVSAHPTTTTNVTALMMVWRTLLWLTRSRLSAAGWIENGFSQWERN